MLIAVVTKKYNHSAGDVTVNHGCNLSCLLYTHELNVRGEVVVEKR